MNIKQIVLEEKNQGGLWDSYKVSGNTELYLMPNCLTVRPNFEFLKQYLQNSTLIDLGCGQTYKNIFYFSALMKVTKYVGVDYYPVVVEKIVKNKINLILLNNIKNPKPESYFYKNDILTFLSKYPKESANIIVNSVDNTNIKSESYKKACGQLIKEVVKPGGIIFGFNSDPIFNYIHGFKDISKDNHKKMGFKIFQKI